jgi:hypothetical protein
MKRYDEYKVRSVFNLLLFGNAGIVAVAYLFEVYGLMLYVIGITLTSILVFHYHDTPLGKSFLDLF